MINYNLNFNLFTLKDNYFDHQSNLHGINHTYRVMCNCLYLGSILNFHRETKLAFLSAFIHDMSRKHDGYCTEHGLWASKEKIPLFKKLFYSINVSDNDIEEIRIAVKNHSEFFELSKADPFYNTTAILKDADALDRIRISANNLKIEFFRFNQSKKIVGFAKKLYFRTINLKIENFNEIYKIAEEISKNVMR